VWVKRDLRLWNLSQVELGLAHVPNGENADLPVLIEVSNFVTLAAEMDEPVTHVPVFVGHGATGLRKFIERQDAFADRRNGSLGGRWIFFGYEGV
jgi:hypothetical protein